MDKIDFSDLSDITKATVRGGSHSSIYYAIYNNKKVVVKAQDVGSSLLACANNRFYQELNFLKLGFEEAVSLIGYGDNFYGEKFLVLEQLYCLETEEWYKLTSEILSTILILHRKSYLNDFIFPISLVNVMKDIDGKIKIIDFNDDLCKKHDNYFTCLKGDSSNSGCGFEIALKKMVSLSISLKINPEKDCLPVDTRHMLPLVKKYEELDLFKTEVERLMSELFYNLVEKEYQSLENVHQPIYWDEYKSIKRTETEELDKNFLKLVDNSRFCVDRSKFLSVFLPDIDNCLDIGCNVGWFCFWLSDMNKDATGVDFDFPGKIRKGVWKNGNGGKIDFANMMSSLMNSRAKFFRKNVDRDYAKKMPKYDLVLALSVLHLFFTQQKMSKQEWILLFKLISLKVNKFLVIEVSEVIFVHLDVKNENAFLSLLKQIGNFKGSKILGKSDNGRNIVVFFK